MSSNDTAEKRKAGEDTNDSNKKQKTIEDSMGAENGHDSKADSKNHDEQGNSSKTTPKKGTANSDSKDPNSMKKGDKDAFQEVKSSTDDVHHAAEEEQDAKTADIKENKDSIKESSSRASTIPSSILEKGIIYFFFRGRIGVEDPQGPEDVARSYIVLRPMPIGAKLGSGPLEDRADTRVLALPKKVLPRSKQDRFLVFVDAVGKTVEELRDGFRGGEYATKTTGTSNSPAATPIAEGIYAITSTGRESHLAYMITVPSTIGDLQKDMGVNEKGSFVCSVKNPEAPGPANAQIDNPAKYSEELQKKFRGLRWNPLEPAQLDYVGTQMLIIGEGLGSLGRAVEEQGKDAKDDGKDKPEVEMERLEEEDHDRVEGLKEDDPVFADLGMSGKEYPKLETTW